MIVAIVAVEADASGVLGVDLFMHFGRASEAGLAPNRVTCISVGVGRASADAGVPEHVQSWALGAHYVGFFANGEIDDCELGDGSGCLYVEDVVVINADIEVQAFLVDQR